MTGGTMNASVEEAGCREIATVPRSETVRAGFDRVRFAWSGAGRLEICEIAFSGAGIVFSRIVLERVAIWRTP